MPITPEHVGREYPPAPPYIVSHAKIAEFADAVEARLSIEKVRNRGNLDIVTILVDLIVDGDSVCEARSTLMHTREDADA